MVGSCRRVFGVQGSRTLVYKHKSKLLRSTSKKASPAKKQWEVAEGFRGSESRTLVYKHKSKLLRSTSISPPCHGYKTCSPYKFSAARSAQELNFSHSVIHGKFGWTQWASNRIPLARNQYINNSPGIFSCIRTGANTGATCIRPERISLKNLANMQKRTPQKYFPVFAQCEYRPRMYSRKN